jgi:GH15 family glucan-1,4-alpha-glucosidase
MKLEAYGFIGDMRGAALVGPHGSIDWLCLPRFDSDASCCALLGDRTNGYWQIAPNDSIRESRQRYRGSTLVLETELATAAGKVRLIDCLPIGGPHEVLRIVEGLEGSVEMTSTLSLRNDYGRCSPWLRKKADGNVTAIAGPDAWLLRSAVGQEIRGRDIVSGFTATPGSRHSFSLVWYPSRDPSVAESEPEIALNRTVSFWENWAARCTYRGPWREQVVRSLLTLKALTFSATGGIVAAPTTSVPEWIGGVRNWDYRYCWLRDATFTLLSFMDTGYTEEAAAWIEWLLRAAAGDTSQLQIMYGIGGERRLKEFTLPHLKGYEDSQPVRIGNAAAEQFQLDVYGEVIDALHFARTVGLTTSPDAWKLEVELIEFVCKNWDKPDDGIWEIRGPRRHFTHSKLMAWVALDRAVKAVEQFQLPGDADRWRELRKTIHDDICARGYQPSRGAFTQFYGSDKLDASLLMMPLVGFLPANDPRVRSTIEAIERELTHEGMVHRYHPEKSAAIDGLPPGEGAFLPCSFWLVDCLAQLGRNDDARRLFETLLAKTSPLGLLAEEYDSDRRRLVGNFPQAFSHIGLVNSAQNLGETGPADQRSHT